LQSGIYDPRTIHFTTEETMMHHERLRDPACFDPCWSCKAHGVYACIPCQTAPVPVERQEAATKAALLEARALDAEARADRLARALDDAIASRQSLFNRMLKRGGRHDRR
jgi:hypothetical protein